MEAVIFQIPNAKLCMYVQNKLWQTVNVFTYCAGSVLNWYLESSFFQKHLFYNHQSGRLSGNSACVDKL